jgi:hypothetical protein
MHKNSGWWSVAPQLCRRKRLILGLLLDAPAQQITGSRVHLVAHPDGLFVDSTRVETLLERSVAPHGKLPVAA